MQEVIEGGEAPVAGEERGGRLEGGIRAGGGEGDIVACGEREEEGGFEGAWD